MVRDPARESLWAAVAAFAAVGQGLLLVANAVIVWDYLQETKKLRIATRDQVDESKKLVVAAQQQLDLGQLQARASLAQVDAAQKQLAVSQEQIRMALQDSEAQIRPAVSIRHDPNWQRFGVENVGSGPAFDLSFVQTATDSPIQWDTQPNVATALNGSFLGAGQQGGPLPNCGGVQVEVQIIYRSLSGRRYVSIVRFDNHGVPVRTRFLSDH